VTGPGLLLLLLPDEVLALVLAVGFVAAMLGLVAWRTIFGFVALFAVATALAPVVADFVAGLDAWVQLLLLTFLGLAVLRGVLALVLGGGVADHAVGQLTYVLLTLPFRMARGLVRVAAASLRLPRG